jgi:haloacetate dehalogenase
VAILHNFTNEKLQVSNDVTINTAIAGTGEPLLLIHGYPQTHIMWHKLAPRLAETFTVIAPDLRGYGDSSKPKSKPDHSTYSKRAMADDLSQVMEQLGFTSFYVAGHDRGARVAHRMALDYPARIRKLALLDIIPTHSVFQAVNKEIAMGYYHWFFLCQEDGLPEHMIGLDSAYYLREKLKRWSRRPNSFPEQIIDEYIRCFSSPETIHATCEDYRAAASIDLKHDEANLGQKNKLPGSGVME